MRQRVGLLIALAALGLAACGGDGDGGASRDDFIADGDRICREAEEKTARLQRPDSLEGLGDYFGETSDIVAETKEKFGDLDPPDDEGREVQEAFDEAAEKAVGQFEELKEKIDAGASEAELQKAFEDVDADPTQDAGTKARDYGFKECGSED